MTLDIAHTFVIDPSEYDDDTPLTSTDDVISRLVRRHIERAVAATSLLARESHALRREFIATAVTSFVAADGNPFQAAMSMTPLVSRLAGHYMAHGAGREELSAAFDHAIVGATGAVGVAKRIGMGHAGRSLTRRISSFVKLLHREALAAYEREQFRCALDPESARKLLRQAVFFVPSETYLQDVLQVAKDVEPSGTTVPVVAISGWLPATWQNDSRVLPGLTPSEALCPPELVSAATELPQGTRLVVGPVVSWDACVGALTAARKLASMVRSGEVVDERPIVLYADWIVEVHLHTNDIDAEAMVARHLGPLAPLSRSRRLTLATTLLHRLESGLTVNQLAQAMGIPAQTLHGRIQRLRELLGDNWETDERTRTQLALAARAAIRLWSSE